MARPPLNWREWLEDMRSYNSPDGDRAAQILERLDELEACEPEIAAWDDAGFNSPADAKKTAVRLEAIEAALEQTDIGREMGEADPFETIVAIAAYVQKIEERSFALHELCVSAGLLEPNDHTTDPLPLLAMFLPVD